MDKTPQELKAELKEIELNNPLDYLYVENVTLQYQTKLVKKETFFKKAVYEDDGALIEGYIINNATIAKFKDISFEISYYSKTESLIKKYKPDILYEIYKPNTKTYFSFKVYPPKSYVSFGIKIKTAKPVY
ncbi:MAG: hypothetical protein K0B10_08385 [Vicingaceae bacterium]|nr:hypothetical protein [Vicingaceae bacterium]